MEFLKNFLLHLNWLDIIIQFTGSVALYYNKRHVRDQTPSGWLLAIVGLLILAIPVWQKHFYVAFASHMGMALLAIYGYAVAIKAIHKLKKSIDIALKICVVTLTLCMCGYLAYATWTMSNFTVMQLIQSGSGLLGSLLLAFNKPKMSKFGWSSYILSHAASSTYMFQSELYIISFFQVLSIFVAIDALKNLNKKPARN